jgi:hypothetical protein
MAVVSREVSENPHVTVVGGGISGLYAAYLLARQRYSVELFELHPNLLGGKIATRWYPKGTADDREFRAEFGPMRFELALQVRLRSLCDHLGLTFEPFSGTAGPSIPNEYEMTAVEAAFSTAAELHLWAVLKMFYGREQKVKDDLGTIESEVQISGISREFQAREIGRLQLQYLQCHLDRQVFCDEDPVNHGVMARPPRERDEALDDLRRHQRLGGDNTNTNVPLLRDIGLWHGLSEVISPGAIARIREGGTFYHCIAGNPSAVEWGIFWLRQASVLGTLYTLDSATAKDGIFSIVRELRRKIEAEVDEEGHPLVAIRQGFEVLQVEPAKRPNEVVLRIQEVAKGKHEPHGFNIRTDHVILALPRTPLRRLWEHFPPDVRARIDGVGPLQLLKAFVVTKDPWWTFGLAAQSYAWRVPTRELHFYRESGKPNGMIMLYTDEPAIRYWNMLIPQAHRNSVLWKVFKGGADTALAEVKKNRFGLLEMLIRRLLVLKHPGLPGRLEHSKEDFRTELHRANPVVWTALDELETKAGTFMGESERIVELLANNPPEGASGSIHEAMELTLGKEFVPDEKDWLEAFTIGLRFRKAGVISTKEVDAAATNVLAYGIRDWSAEPYGGAAHFWLPGFSWAHAAPNGTQASDPLLAFNLRERKGPVANVHICGEAYSGDQGFIEGALQTAEDVVRAITNLELPELVADPRRTEERERGEDIRRVALKTKWDNRHSVDGAHSQVAEEGRDQRATEKDCPSWKNIVPTFR